MYPVFIAALFTTARTWKEFKFHQQMNGLGRCWCEYYSIEYYSVIKRNEIGSFVVMWMNLGSVIHSEARKTHIVY